MALVKTKHFASTKGASGTTPDGTSLEELMNAFLVSVPILNVMDVQTSVTSTSTASLRFVGVVVYKE